MRIKLGLYKFFMIIFVGVALVINKLRRYPTGYKCIKNIKYRKNRKLKQCKLDIHYNKKLKKYNSVIFFFHGGGFVSVDKSLYNKYCAMLSSYGHIVISVNYRLAPKVKLHSCITDCEYAVKFMLNKLNKTNKNLKIIFSGDSAGAYIATKLASRIKVDGVVGYYGLYDLKAFKLSGFLGCEIIYYALFGENYKNEDLSKYIMQDEELKRLPSILLVSGEVDCLHKNQTIILKERLEKLGKTPHCEFYDKKVRSSMHGFLVYSSAKPTKLMPEIVDKFVRNIV